MRRLIVIAVFALFTLSACKTPPRLPDLINITANDQRLIAMTHWNLSGRLAFKSEQESFSAYLRWQQRGDDYNLVLSNLVGVTLLSLSVNEGIVTLEADGEIYQHNDAETLIYEVSGWPIPVADMQFWVKGIARQNDIVRRNQQGLIEQLQVLDNSPQWQVDYTQYTQSQETVLPQLLTIRQQQNLSLKLKVNQWEIL
ncbi:lipoprotein insertase outer membrane protein LolB [Alteromonas flava]|uniref:lipoprotein insertase outer membrane protein LolB n=1 Tax=Alteromonas flava TaxID=2048003 RepID=UPI000C287BC6|nr:lipoprotein insertase outer membrane protein LolB [Alteromonas flava]